MKVKRCAHCEREGTVKTVEWNPLDEHWQCRDVVRCAQRSAEAKLAAGPRRATRGEDQ